MRKKTKAVIGLALSVVIGSAFLAGCGSQEKEKNSNNDNAVPTMAEDQNITVTATPTPEQEKGAFTMTKDHVKLLGRTLYDHDILWLSFSGAGAEFKFTGKTCDLMFRADSSIAQPQNAPRFAVYVDGERVLTRTMEEGIETHKIIDASSEEEHIIRIVKLSESPMSTMGVYDPICDENAKIEPTPEKDLKIEFIGDSITCGYGVDGKLGDNFSTSNEDCTKAYAYKTAEKLNADYSLVSMSGYGIISGYTTNGNKVEVQQLPKYYTLFGNSSGSFNMGKKTYECEWDFSQFVPNIVVINLGTNDASYTKGDAAKCEEYVLGYYNFLSLVREKNPDAEIACVLGVMGQDLCPSVEEAVNRFVEDYGDKKVHAFKLDAQGSEVVVDYHPTEKTHEHAADQMVEFLTPLINK